jgi:hypothetical protein
MTLSIPLLDMVIAILRRSVRGAPVMKGDRGHTHHRLQDRGLTKAQTVMALFLATAMAGFCALLQMISSPTERTMFWISFLTLITVGVCWLRYSEFASAMALFRTAGFRSGVNTHLDLWELQRQIDSASNLDQCWQALKHTLTRHGATRVALKTAHFDRCHTNSAETGPEVCIPLPYSAGEIKYTLRMHMNPGDTMAAGLLLSGVSPGLCAKVAALAVGTPSLNTNPGRERSEPAPRLSHVNGAVQRVSPIWKFAQLPRSEQSLLMQLLILIPCIKVALHIVPFRTLHHAIARVKHNELRPDAVRKCELLARNVSRASRAMPREGKCLAEALASQLLLNRLGVTSTLHIGVARQECGGLAAHAWLEREGSVIVGGLGAGLLTYTGIAGVDAVARRSS